MNEQSKYQPAIIAFQEWTEQRIEIQRGRAICPISNSDKFAALNAVGLTVASTESEILGD